MNHTIVQLLVLYNLYSMALEGRLGHGLVPVVYPPLS